MGFYSTLTLESVRIREANVTVDAFSLMAAIPGIQQCNKNSLTQYHGVC